MCIFLVYCIIPRNQYFLLQPGLISLCIFIHNSNSIKIIPCCNSVISVLGHQIATKFCTCHDSFAVVACANFCSDHFARIWMTAQQMFLKFELWWTNHQCDVRQGGNAMFLPGTWGGTRAWVDDATRNNMQTWTSITCYLTCNLMHMLVL